MNDDRIAAKVAQVMAAEADWLNARLGELLAAGHSRAEIEVRYFVSDPGRVEIAVGGQVRHQRRAGFTALGSC